MIKAYKTNTQQIPKFILFHMLKLTINLYSKSSWWNFILFMKNQHIHNFSTSQTTNKFFNIRLFQSIYLKYSQFYSIQIFYIIVLMSFHLKLTIFQLNKKTITKILFQFIESQQMDHDQEQRKIYESDNERYEWINKNEYQKLVSGFVHDQNVKIKLSMQNDRSMFKIEEKLITNGKNYQFNGTFHTWNIVPSNIQSALTDPFSKKLTQAQSIFFGTYKNNLKMQWRFGERLYKNFRFNPFINVEVPTDLHDLNFTFGLRHKSTHLNLLTKLTASIIENVDFIHKARIQYAVNQMLFGVSSSINSKLNCQITKSLLGYQFSPKDYFYLRFQTDSINQLIKGKQSDHEVGFYYLRKFSQELKFAFGMKSVNAIDNSLNFIIQSRKPYNLKANIDSKLNIFVTVRKQINNSLAFMYGIGVSNLFQKRSRVQTGLVLEYNA